MPNGRCRMHGGSTPPGPRPALKHGIYASGLRDGEVEVWHSIQIGGLDDEIRLARIQLMRAFGAQREAEGDLETVVVEDEDGVGAHGPFHKTKTVQRRKDFSGEIDRLLGRIGRLESQRAAITGEGQDRSPEEWADAIRSAMGEIEDSDGPDA